MIQKNFHLNDVQRSKLRNQFTKVGPSVVLNDNSSNDLAGKFYCITEVRASGAWSANITLDTRNFNRTGNGTIQFYHPICGELITFTNVIEVSGFFLG